MADTRDNYISPKFLDCVYVLNSRYEIKHVIDVFSDFLWTERYYGYGEFEIMVPVREDIIENCRIKDYISIRESNIVMIVESIGTYTDPENGDRIVISGRSLETLLMKRYILKSYETEAPKDKPDEKPKVNVQTLFDQMITDAIIAPTIAGRKIENFIFRPSSNPAVASLYIESTDHKGNNLYDDIDGICKEQELGYQVVPQGVGGFAFELYFGVDRSWDQTGLPPVVFSDGYENLRNSNYLQSEREYMSTVFIETEIITETSTSTTTEEVIFEVNRTPARTGIDRIEGYIRDINVQTQKEANQRGSEYLADHKVTKLFDGDVESSVQYRYGVDYNIGDIVQVENKYGQKGRCRVTEVVMSRNLSGPNLTPTFEVIEEKED